MVVDGVRHVWNSLPYRHKYPPFINQKLMYGIIDTTLRMMPAFYCVYLDDILNVGNTSNFAMHHLCLPLSSTVSLNIFFATGLR